MPSLAEWLNGVTAAGETLPVDKVAYYRAQADDATWRHCVHRGAIMRHRKADLCGLPQQLYPVFACALHQQCVLTRFCKKQPERLCWTCDDAAAAEG